MSFRRTNREAEDVASRQKRSGPAHEGLTHLGKGHTDYPDQPDRGILEAFTNAAEDRDYWVAFDCPEFTALCPITGQPDFGRLSIRYVPDRLCLESKSLKLYLFSFRNHGAFHEEVVNRILDDVAAAIQPRKLQVKGVFNPRGGIGLTVEVEYPKTKTRTGKKK